MTAVLRISERDNVATALEGLEPARVVEVGEVTIVVRERIPAGHKLALAAMGAGERVVKYGSPIGVASRPIDVGEHVHTHNMASTRGRGDLAERERLEASDARLAEPVDEADADRSALAPGEDAGSDLA